MAKVMIEVEEGAVELLDEYIKYNDFPNKWWWEEDLEKHMSIADYEFKALTKIKAVANAFGLYYV